MDRQNTDAGSLAPSGSSFRSKLTWVILVALILVSVVLIRPGRRVTRDNFDRIRIGANRLDVAKLLGGSRFQTTESGLVEGPQKYVTNASQTAEEGRRRGFQQYQREQWNSSEISITVISDLTGKVVCKYSSEGQPSSGWLNWLRNLW